jgi:hypothetical protein
MFSFYKLFCDDNFVNLWRKFAFVIGSSLVQLEWFICDEHVCCSATILWVSSLFFGALAPTLVICDEVTKFATVETTSLTNNQNVSRKSA